jgi:2-dehydro-3-deoxyphosphogluconate aldolase/(4S)-4-hydroxy-2-oxoglutarate aldolase
MCGWLSTSDPSALLIGLRSLPLLAVLRPQSLEQARLQLTQLQQAGLSHVELAVQPTRDWLAMATALVREFPGLQLGAASVRCSAGLAAACEAGLGYAVSPILDRELLEQAAAASITLVPGVFSPTEIAAAVRWGVPAVKLYPAAALGAQYWRSLAGPLDPLPFCIAAGGLAVADVEPWLAAGVNALALGSSLFAGDGLDPALNPLVVKLRSKCYP